MLSFPTIPSCAWTHPLEAADQSPQRPKVSGQHDGGCLNGVPIGGLGTGGIGRDFKGAFRRWTLKTGSLKRFVEPVNAFSLFVQKEGQEPTARVLHPGYPTGNGDERPLSAWQWDDNLTGTYGALFPKAWYAYDLDDQPVDVVCEQFSPVIAHDYERSSYPVGVFKWTVRNSAETPVDVSLMFSFANLVGWFKESGRDKPFGQNPGNVNRVVTDILDDNTPMRAIAFERIHTRTPPREGNGSFAIAVKGGDDLTLSHQASFDALGNGADVWEAFSQTGLLPNSDETWVSGTDFSYEPTGLYAGALAAKRTVAPGECAEIVFTVAWDLPVIAFGSGREYFRRHTEYFGVTGANAPDIAKRGLTDYEAWSNAIDAWHNTVIARHRYPDWYYAMLFNELYLLVDGYTAWTANAVNGGPATQSFFLIECPEYPYYNTFDLWVYASFSIITNWPEIEKSVIRTYAEKTLADDPRLRHQLHGSAVFPITEEGATPHDIGAPDEDPVAMVNSYGYRNTNAWKDLNSQFVLIVWRDFLATGDHDLLKDCYPAVVAALTRLARYDIDADGLIEHDGTPDQTFDNIAMFGPGSYCGGLWLSALGAAARMARIMGETERAETWEAVRAKGGKSFDDKLWNGTHYRIDTKSPYSERVFIEQIFGLWYGALTGLGMATDDAHAVEALRAVYKENFLGYEQGRYGAANIAGFDFTDDAVVDEFGNLGDPGAQATEALTGMNLSFANELAHFGLKDEAESVLRSVYRMIYDEKDLWFRTPAAWDRDRPIFRAIMNMRPLVIWAQEFPPVEHA